MNSKTLFAVLVISFFYTEARSEVITLKFESQCAVTDDFSVSQFFKYDCRPSAIAMLISDGKFVKNSEEPNQYDYSDKPAQSSELSRISNLYEEKARALACESRGGGGAGGPCKKTN